MAEPTRAAEDYTVIWEPQPGPQTALIACPVFEVFFGGARGGGKTDGMLGEFASHADLYNEHASGLMVRQNLTELRDTIDRSRQIYGQLGAEYLTEPKTWKFPNGAKLRFAYLENDSDADAYQGHSYSRVYVEEIGNFPSPAPINKLKATLRSGAGVPCCFRASGNPGGAGHSWVKARYIDPAPLGWKIIKEEFINPFSGERTEKERVFIPSRLTDNKYLGSDYVSNLQSSGSAELVRAWLEGDWSVITGAYFPEFSQKHIVEPFEIPSDWVRFRAMDWGSSKPFSVGWFAISDGTRGYPPNAIIQYREWYGCSSPNVGLKLTAEEVGDGIKKRTSQSENIVYTTVDPAMYKEDGGPSHAERMRGRGIHSRAADNSRIAGWDMLRARLKGIDGVPMIYFFSTCVHSIRTIPALQHDPLKAEDVDTEGEDHAGDMVRYACMSRPFRAPAVVSKPLIKPLAQWTLNELIADNEHKKVERRRI